MNRQSIGGTRLAYLVFVAAVFVWGVLGVANMPFASYSGYTTTPQNVVNQVQRGSPAETAGLMVGDEITAFDGIAVEDTRTLSRMPRLVPGTVRDIGVVRDGQPVTVTLTYAGLPPSERAISWASVILGVLFLFLPFLASRGGTASGAYLAWFGACFGLSFMPGPYFASPALRGLATTFTLAAIVLGFALLLRFVMSFPQDTPSADSPKTRALVWGPALLIALMFAYVMLAQPAATSGLNLVINLLVGLFVIGYFGAALIVLMRKYRDAPPDMRTSSGLNFVVWGAVIGLIPPLLASVLSLIAPMMVLPGQQYFFLFLGAIPILFSHAVSRSGENGML